VLPLRGTLVRELKSCKSWGVAKNKRKKKKTQKLNGMISVILGSMASYVRNCPSQMPAGKHTHTHTHTHTHKLVNFVQNGYLQDY